jgi:peptidoglycan hydrolase-like protein with peptidoglycan-binding domain
VDRRHPSYARWLQTALNSVIGDGLPVDGAFGPRTQVAVKKFQSSRGLVADGVMGARTEAALVSAGAAPVPGGTAGAATPGVPSVIKRESDPPQSTLYLNIPLGGEAPAQAETGMFVPANFKPMPSVDLIVYLHGFKRYGPSIAMSGYWDKRRFPQHALREATNQGGKNVILVAPTLGPRSQAGRLVSAGGFDQYLERVLAAIGQHVYGGAAPAPQLGTLIVASHSGGGLPMRHAVLGSRKYAANIRECWGFDCMYGGASEARQWAQWAASQPTRRLFVYYTDTGGTRANSAHLKGLGIPNVHVERTAASHDRVQISHWLTRLSAASFLATR